jgi:hypothetical protein
MRIDPKNIKADTLALEAIIREYSEQQADAWRQVPYWALMATFPEKGEEQTIDSYLWRQMETTRQDIFARIRAFRFGYWGIAWNPSTNRINIAVDLENGKLLDMHSLTHYSAVTDAARENILQLGDRLNELDALKVLDDFKIRHANRTAPQKIRTWQQQALQKYGLSPYGYVRT